MPLVLGIDCALRWLNLGLADGDKALAETNLDVGRGQSELLANEVEHFLSRRKLSLRDIELISVTIGPGFYTGIRVGVAYATALAEALGLEIAPVATFHALAYDLLNADLLVAPIIRANSRTLYGALYKGHVKLFSGLYEPRQFTDLLRAHRTPENPIVVGAEVRSWQEFSALGCPLMERRPSIGLNTALAAESVSAQDPTEVKALYMREPD